MKCDFDAVSRTRILYSATTIAILSITVAIGFSQPTYGQPATANSSSAKVSPLHGQKLVASCAACHGPQGNTSIDPSYPKIGGQKYSYLLQELHVFKSGARESDIMSGIVANLSNAQLVEAARFFSRQTVKPNVVKDRKLARVGARVFNSSTRRAPPCAACHSNSGSGGMGGGMMGHMGMSGNTAGVPRLFGQNPAYTVLQLDAFAAGKRRGTVMGPIAASLTEQHRKAVAEYLSGLK